LDQYPDHEEGENHDLKSQDREKEVTRYEYAEKNPDPNSDSLSITLDFPKDIKCEDTVEGE